MTSYLHRSGVAGASDAPGSHTGVLLLPSEGRVGAGLPERILYDMSNGVIGGS